MGIAAIVIDEVIREFIARNASGKIDTSHLAEAIALRLTHSGAPVDELLEGDLRVCQCESDPPSDNQHTDIQHTDEVAKQPLFQAAMQAIFF